MKRLLPVALFLAAMGLSAATAVTAKVPLGEVRHVTDRLVAARIADRIRKTCPSIGARLLHAFSEARKLENWALGQGYSREEIKAYLKDKAEKQRIYERAEAYLSAHGATAGDVEGFCALGVREIEAGSLVGSLIYEK